MIAPSARLMTGSTHKTLCIGLTGGIGCGKSTVARLFEELGVVIIDADAISHKLTQAGGQAIPTVRAAFGAAYLTPAGALDRARGREVSASWKTSYIRSS
jgi:dephospho-CoA kinase